ncbi:MAG: tetratricopeptide repeat protein [Fibrobacterales bacterium]
MTEETQNHDKLQSSVHKSVEHVRTKLVPDYGSKIVIALIIMTGLIIGFISMKSGDAQKIKADRETLGKAIYFINANENDSAEAALQNIFTKAEIAPTIAAKGALLYGNLLLEKGDITGAQEKFVLAIAKAGTQLMIKSAAEHGVATSYIQQKEYAKAIAALNAYMKNYARKTSALPGIESPTDLVVDIPDVLWKIALCQKELKDTAAAKAACQKIIDLYNTNRQFSSKAQALIASL